ncbi:MAG: hypothetical protein QM612_08770 [Thermomonas sp.]|uniref:hypothetical protein n=1 Tax=Thermomonas sp. TaxID=1971895 RepID=UPI0039E5D0E3
MGHGRGRAGRVPGNPQGTQPRSQRQRDAGADQRRLDERARHAVMDQMEARSMKAILIAATLMVAAPAANAQNFLERINNGLEKANKTLAGQSAPARTAAPMPGTMQPSERQMQQMVNALVAPGKPDEVRPMYEASRDTILEILLISSCNFSNPESLLRRFSAPDASLSFVAANVGMRYHPASECLDVERVDGWKMKAKNAFRFRVLFASEQSGESSQRHYELVKQPDGAWLLRHAAPW